MKKFHKSLTALALGSAVVLAGCSDSGESAAPVTETETVVSTEVSTEVTTVTSHVSAEPTTSSASASASTAKAYPLKVTETGFVLGDEAADNNVTIYQDFNCPHCLNLHASMDEQGSIDKWIEEGASVTLVPVNYLGPRTTHNFSGRASNAIAMVAENHPEKFLAAQAELYKIRPEKTTSELDDADIEKALEAAGIELTDADKSAIENMEYKAWVDAATAAAAEKGVNYIPQLWVNDELKEIEDDQEDGDLLDLVTF